MKYRLVGLGGESQFCELCGNDFNINPGGCVIAPVNNEFDSLDVCSKHVPKHVRLGQTFECDYNIPKTV